MKKNQLLKIFLVLIIIAGVPSINYAAKISIVAGDPTANGDFKFTLVNPHGAPGPDFPVTVTLLKSDNAAQKAIKIQAAVAALGNGWACDIAADGVTCTFKKTQVIHPNSETLDVITLKDFDDKSKENEKIGAVAASSGAKFDFGLCNVNSTGLDDDGNPSILLFSTSVGSYATTIPANVNVVTLIDGLYNDLLADGVNITRTSPYTISINDPSPNAFMAYTMNDMGLCLSGTGGTLIFPIPTLPQWGLILMALMLISIGVFYFKK